MSDTTTAPAAAAPASGDVSRGDKFSDFMESARKAESASAGKSADTPPADGKPPAPADGQGKATDTTTADDGKSKSANSDPAPLSDEDFAKAAKEALGLKPEPAKTADYYRKQYEDSSRDGRIKAAQLAEMRNALAKKLGLEPVKGKDGLEFKRNKEYVATKAAELAEKTLKGLSAADRDLAIDRPEEFARVLASRFVEGQTPDASIDKVEIDDAAIAQVRKAMAEAKVGDQLEFAELKEFEPYVDALAAETSAEAEAFRDFMKSSPENYAYGLRLLFGRVYHRLSPLMQKQREAKEKLSRKRQDAEADVSLASEQTQRGGAAGGHGEGSATPEATRIAKARGW